MLTPIERIAAVLLGRSERGPRCRVCGTRGGDRSVPFCSDEHAEEWTRENAW